MRKCGVYTSTARPQFIWWRLYISLRLVDRTGVSQASLWWWCSPIQWHVDDVKIREMVHSLHRFIIYTYNHGLGHDHLPVCMP